jgi:hypothetical protein
LNSNILNINGVIIIKTSDFQFENKELKGSYNIHNIFKSNNFSLYNQIIYKHNFNTQNNFINDIKNIHTTFLIFKKLIS